MAGSPLAIGAVGVALLNVGLMWLRHPPLGPRRRRPARAAGGVAEQALVTQSGVCSRRRARTCPRWAGGGALAVPLGLACGRDSSRRLRADAGGAAQAVSPPPPRHRRPDPVAGHPAAEAGDSTQHQSRCGASSGGQRRSAADHAGFDPRHRAAPRAAPPKAGRSSPVTIRPRRTAQQRLVDPALDPFPVADAPPGVELGHHLDRHAAAHEHPFHRIGRPGPVRRLASSVPRVTSAAPEAALRRRRRCRRSHRPPPCGPHGGEGGGRCEAMHPGSAADGSGRAGMRGAAPARRGRGGKRDRRGVRQAAPGAALRRARSGASRHRRTIAA